MKTRSGRIYGQDVVSDGQGGRRGGHKSGVDSSIHIPHAMLQCQVNMLVVNEQWKKEERLMLNLTIWQRHSSHPLGRFIKQQKIRQWKSRQK